MVHSLNLDSDPIGPIVRQDEGLRLAAEPKTDQRIHLIDPVDQIYSYTSTIGRLVGWVLYQCGFTIRAWDEEAKKNIYYSLNSTLRCLFNTPNKNLSTDELAASEKLRDLTTRLFFLLDNREGDKKVTVENFTHFVRNFRSHDFLARLHLAHDQAQAEQIAEKQFQPFFNEIAGPVSR